MTVPGELTGRAIGLVQTGGTLARETAAAAFQAVLIGDFTGADVAWGALFAALHSRGASADEVLGLLDAILTFDPELAGQLADPVRLGLDNPVVAVTGSGKESFKTFNVSTAAAFVAAAHPGLCVIKPAGRATSAISGASDVLENLGIGLPKTIDQVAAMARGCGIGVFDYHLVAPRYGPRYEGRFQHLHPLSHVTPWRFIPFAVDGLLFGTAEPRVELAAEVMAATGVPRAAVVSTGLGRHGRIDEDAPFGEAITATVADGSITVERIDRPLPDDLVTIAQRGDHTQNAARILDVLHGRASATANAVVSANAGLLLHLAGLVPDPGTGAEMAARYLRDGAALRQLERTRAASHQSRDQANDRG